MQDVVALDISVQDVRSVHFGETKCDLVEGVAAKILRVLQPTLKYDVLQRALIHVFENNDDFLVEVV